MEKKAFYQGKYFESVEEMLKYRKQWPYEQVDLNAYEEFLKQRLGEAKINLELRGSFTNLEAYRLLRMNTDFVESCPENE